MCASAGLVRRLVVKTGHVQGREDAQCGYLDVEALAGELLAPGSVFAFLTKHPGRLFPEFDDGGPLPVRSGASIQFRRRRSARCWCCRHCKDSLTGKPPRL
jgi:hypothetical protein